MKMRQRDWALCTRGCAFVRVYWNMVYSTKPGMVQGRFSWWCSIYLRYSCHWLAGSTLSSFIKKRGTCIALPGTSYVVYFFIHILWQKSIKLYPGMNEVCHFYGTFSIFFFFSRWRSNFQCCVCTWRAPLLYWMSVKIRRTRLSRSCFPEPSWRRRDSCGHPQASSPGKWRKSVHREQSRQTHTLIVSYHTTRFVCHIYGKI